MQSIGENDPDSSVQNTFSEYVSMLLYYVRERSQVYIFASAALISLFIASSGMPYPLIAIKLVLGVYLVSLATYVYNDATDTAVDKINASNRLLVSGKATKRSVITLALLMLSSGLALTISINPYTALIAAICVGLAVVYSHPRTHFKDKFPYKTLINASGAGFAALIGGVAIGNVSIYVIFASVVAFLFLLVLGPLGDIDDYKGDRRSRKRTFPVVIGIKPTIIMMLSIPLSIIMIAILLNPIINLNLMGLVMLTGICAYSFTRIRLLFSKWHDRQFVQTSRHKLRFMHLILQLSVLVGLLRI